MKSKSQGINHIFLKQLTLPILEFTKARPEITPYFANDICTHFGKHCFHSESILKIALRKGTITISSHNKEKIEVQRGQAAYQKSHIQ